MGLESPKTASEETATEEPQTWSGVDCKMTQLVGPSAAFINTEGPMGTVGEGRWI